MSGGSMIGRADNPRGLDNEAIHARERAFDEEAVLAAGDAGAVVEHLAPSRDGFALGGPDPELVAHLAAWPTATERGEHYVPEKPRVYVAGPMRGYPAFNFPAFDQAAFDLRALGWDVFNPAAVDRRKYGHAVADSPTGDLADIAETGFDLRAALGEDLRYITAEADAVAVLPGWETSSGARAEVSTALALGIPVAPVDAFEAGLIVALAQIREVPARPTEFSTQPLNGGEVRTTSSTGGEKGVKLARYDLIPAGPLRALAEHYGRGAHKYADHQWRRGYEWSKSFAALMRHAWAFWGGEDLDAETGSPHLAAVAWHAFALLEFAELHSLHDDRPGGQQ